MIRVLLADDHPLIRQSVRRILEPVEDIEVVGLAANGREAVALAEREAPDVILMDLEMPELDGATATGKITAALPDTKVVVLTTFADHGRVLDAIDAGATGYLLKDAEPGEIVDAVRQVAAGHAPLAPRAAEALLSERVRRRPVEGLTAREREVLALVAEALPNRLIARRLGIARGTVKGHLTNIFQTIGVTDRTQAALWARRHGVATKRSRT